LLTEKMALERQLSEHKAEQSREGMRKEAEAREVLEKQRRAHEHAFQQLKQQVSGLVV
jgi:hypothetical protein